MQTDLVVLKNNFHQLIDNLNDIQVLETLYKLVSSFQREQEMDILDDLTVPQQQRLQQSLQQSENPANLHTHENVKQEIQQWLIQ
jgi:hypothetical protein